MIDLLEEAIDLVGDLPESHKVFVTGFHVQEVDILRRDLKASGLVGVEILFPYQILQRQALRGCRGILLIDAFYQFRQRDQVALMHEKKILEAHG